MPTDATVRLGEEDWTITFVTRSRIPKDRLGDCNRLTKRIRVRKDLPRELLLDTLIHEIRHAQHPVMFEAEEFIDWTSSQIAAALVAADVVK